MMRAIEECNQAIFSNDQTNKALNYPILDIPLLEEGFDLVYLDPPYISSNGVVVNYRDFYHFLEGICNYDNWEEMIDFESKHRRLKAIPDKWSDPKQISYELSDSSGCQLLSLKVLSANRKVNLRIK